MNATTGGGRRSVAIVGAGISGLTAAYLLRRTHDVTVFERNAYAGGHANTVDVGAGGGRVAVDTGFIVFNETTYPGFTALLRQLNVATQPGDMSFGCTCWRCGVAYSSRGLPGVFASASSFVRPSHWRLLPELDRFFAHARLAVRRQPSPTLTLGQYARRFGETRALIAHYLVPMTAAIWSTPPSEALNMPFVRVAGFLANHGLVGWKGRLQWRTVTGGSRRYVEQIRAALPEHAICLESPVESVIRDGDGAVVTANGRARRFDSVIMACHADEALSILRDASPTERTALEGFRYTRNRAVLHTDASVLPRATRARASWNVSVRDCRDPEPQLTMTYDMNRLQSLPGPVSYCVSVNPGDEIDQACYVSVHEYTHPEYTTRTVEAQRLTADIQGTNNTYFAGAHLGYGFHEDGYQSGVRAATALMTGQ